MCECCLTAKADDDLCENCQQEYHTWLVWRDRWEREQVEQVSRLEWVSVQRDSVDTDLEGPPF